MAESVKILVEYEAATAKFRAETDAGTASVTKLDNATEKLGNEAKETAAKAQQSAKTLGNAYKQQEGIVNKLRDQITKLSAARDRSNNPVAIQRFNKLIEEQNSRLKTLTTTAVQSAQAQQKAVAQSGSQFNSLKALATQLGPAISVAFGVQQIEKFVEAYVDAEKNASLLLNALGGNEAVQARLLRQAADFQNTTVYDDDTIIRAQTFLATQGRNEAQIQKTVAAAVELSSVTGDDLQTSVEKLDATYEGSIGRLGKLDGDFKKLTQTELANGAAIDLVLEKYEGFAVAAGETTAGKIAKARNQLGEFQEFIGGQLVLSIGGVFDAFNSGNITDFLSNLDEAYARVNPLGIGLAGLIGTANNFNQALQALNDGDFGEFFERLGAAALDLAASFNPLVGGAQLLVEKLGIVSTELSEADQLEQRLTARQNAFNTAILEGGDALDVFYKRAVEVLGATREEFDAYVAVQRKKIGADKEDNEQVKEKITLLQALTKEMQGLTSEVQNTIAAGGIVQQSDINRIIELENRIKSTAEEYAKFIQRTRDRTGFNATDTVTVEQAVTQTGEFDLQPAKDYAQALFEINEEGGDRILEGFKADEAAKREELEKTKQTQKQFAIDTLNGIIDIAGQINDVIAQRQLAEIDRTKDAQIKAVEESTLSEEDKQKRISTINKKAAQEQYQIQLKQFRVSQALQIANATIQGAQAVLAAFSSGAAIPIAGIAVGPAFAAVAAALAAAQIAVIAAQPPPPAPSFSKGTEYVKLGSNKPGVDTIPANLDEGEAVIKAKENSKYKGLAKAWNAGLLEQYIQRNFAAPMIEEAKRKAAKANMGEMASAFALSVTNSGKFDDGRMFGGIRETNRQLHIISETLREPKRRRG